MNGILRYLCVCAHHCCEIGEHSILITTRIPHNSRTPRAVPSSKMETTDMLVNDAKSKILVLVLCIPPPSPPPPSLLGLTLASTAPASTRPRQRASHQKPSPTPTPPRPPNTTTPPHPTLCSTLRCHHESLDVSLGCTAIPSSARGRFPIASIISSIFARIAASSPGCRAAQVDPFERKLEARFFSYTGSSCI
jgi:hypothetical protein